MQGNETFSIRALGDGNYTVSLTVTDTLLNTPFVRTANNTIVSVENAAPTLVVDSVEGVEGSPVTLSAKVFDFGNDTHTYVINWGDGTANSSGNVVAGGLSETHTYPQDGVYQASLMGPDSLGHWCSRRQCRAKHPIVPSVRSQLGEELTQVRWTRTALSDSIPYPAEARRSASTTAF
ncbi:MAG: PKD domain-containing protein [Planctomycetaceae bacterium]|nr:PKD domain-containing protein [Planctomycetales bacterium]MCB9875700.1 PKD domain-containing protein [Planctomycetaceae bacterium]